MAALRAGPIHTRDVIQQGVNVSLVLTQTFVNRVNTERDTGGEGRTCRAFPCRHSHSKEVIQHGMYVSLKVLCSY